MIRALFLGAFVLLAACSKDEKPVTQCDEETACPIVGEVCKEGQCVEAVCANSAQCPMESYCLGGECLPGCSEESDCYPGYTCDTPTQTCVAEACTDTQNDCGFKEFCNLATGDCYDAGGQYCSFCDEDSECGEGNYCINHYCGVDCAAGQECPAGFECYPFGDQNGNIITYQCFTYCWLFEDPEGMKGKPMPPLPPKGKPLPLDLLPAGGESPESH